MNPVNSLLISHSHPPLPIPSPTSLAPATIIYGWAYQQPSMVSLHSHSPCFSPLSTLQPQSSFQKANPANPLQNPSVACHFLLIGYTRLHVPWPCLPFHSHLIRCSISLFWLLWLSLLLGKHQLHFTTRPLHMLFFLPKTFFCPISICYLSLPW